MISQQFSRYHFQGQHDNEQVLRIIHRHWFNISIHYLVVFSFAFILFGSINSLPFLFPEMITATNRSLFFFAQNTLLIFLWLYGFLVWVDYYFDVWIITNERIVNIEQRGLFIRHISELRFSRVQDVTSQVSGLIATILNFGDVYVQTAAEEERFIFRQVGDPFAIKDEIMQLSREATKENMQDLASALDK